MDPWILLPTRCHVEELKTGFGVEGGGFFDAAVLVGPEGYPADIP